MRLKRDILAVVSAKI